MSDSCLSYILDNLRHHPAPLLLLLLLAQGQIKFGRAPNTVAFFMLGNKLLLCADLTTAGLRSLSRYLLRAFFLLNQVWNIKHMSLFGPLVLTLQK